MRNYSLAVPHVPAERKSERRNEPGDIFLKSGSTVRRHRRMSNARLIIAAVILEGRFQADVARDYHVSISWVSKFLTRCYFSRETFYCDDCRDQVDHPAW